MLHKILPVIILLCLLILCVPLHTLAEGTPEVIISCRPETLIQPTEVTLSFTVINNTGNDCNNLYISTSDGLISEPLGSLHDGEDLSFSRRHNVTEAELLAESIIYTLTYDDPGAPEHKINLSAEASVQRAETRSECEFTRRFSSDTVASGGTVTILYTVRNTGNTVLEGLQITDILGDFTGRIEKLPAGESRSLVSRVTLNKAALSRPSLNYYTDEGLHTIALSESEIGISSPGIRVEFRVDPDVSDPSKSIGKLVLKNTGDSDYSNLMVTDDFSGDIIAESITLPAGETIAIENTFPVRGTADVRRRIIARSSDGTKLDMITETIRVTEPDHVDLSDAHFTVEAVTPRIKRSGNAKLLLHIENSGDASVRNVHISERSHGDVLDLMFVSAGDHVDRVITIPVHENTELIFNMDYTDADGWQYSSEAPPVSIVIAPDGVLPEDSVSSIIDFSGGSVRIGGSSMFAILLIIGILLLIILTVILIVMSHRAKIRKQVRKALQKQNKGKV